MDSLLTDIYINPSYIKVPIEIGCPNVRRKMGHAVDDS